MDGYMLLRVKNNILPHISIAHDVDGMVAVSVEDYELFDYIDDYITEECGFDWLDKSQCENEQGEVHTMYFDKKHAFEEVEAVLLKLNPLEIRRIYALNNSQIKKI